MNVIFNVLINMFLLRNFKVQSLHCMMMAKYIQYFDLMCQNQTFVSKIECWLLMYKAMT